MPLVPDMSLGAYASIFQDLDDKTVCLLDGNFSADDLRKVLAVLDPETAQLQARVAELEAALSLMYEFHKPMAWGSETNKREALEEARKALGVEE